MKKIIILILVPFLFSCYKKSNKLIKYDVEYMNTEDIIKSPKTEEFIIYSLKNPSSDFYVYNDYYKDRMNSNLLEIQMNVDENSIKTDIQEQKFIEKFKNKMYKNGYKGSEDRLTFAGKNEYQKYLLENYKSNYSEEELKKFDKIDDSLNLIKEQLHLSVINKIKNSKIIALRSDIKLVNNSNQIIEDNILNSLYVFDYGYTKFVYRKTYVFKFAKLNNWPPNDTIEVQLDDILNYANNYNKKVFEVHKPAKITHYIYIISSNSIGYTNVKYTPITFKNKFGEIIEQSEFDDKNFGELILKEVL